jgi:hypothetical protein
LSEGAALRAFEVVEAVLVVEPLVFEVSVEAAVMSEDGETSIVAVMDASRDEDGLFLTFLSFLFLAADLVGLAAKKLHGRHVGRHGMPLKHVVRGLLRPYFDLSKDCWSGSIEPFFRQRFVPYSQGHATVQPLEWGTHFCGDNCKGVQRRLLGPASGDTGPQSREQQVRTMFLVGYLFAINKVGLLLAHFRLPLEKSIHGNHTRFAIGGEGPKCGLLKQRIGASIEHEIVKMLAHALR